MRFAISIPSRLFHNPAVKPGPDSLHELLKKYFGFASFRPLQAEIIHDALAGKDVFAVLPTGGGKSLCFQLPALAQPGLTVVVSPLIALMKDQVDALQAAGVPATFLNSSLAAGQSRPRLHGLHNGEFRLLYVAPERLMLPGFLDDLRRWKANLFAIDEAHCVSEWGHDFRPEYRQLAVVRDRFADVPVMALTATATERVREDIVRQLRLRDPACYVASFNRPNLTYRVAAKSGAYEQILSFVQARPNESGIVYVQARKTAEELARKLSVDGVMALPYHAGMASDERSQSQEAFLRDEARVICATIAFGMGINKPNVRFVIHYDLPKNIEGYYQETGRAGRDGLPSECLLMFSPGDRVKQMRFIDEKPDLQERQIARAQLEQMIHYAEVATCRREFLLGYFGEKMMVREARPYDEAPATSDVNSSESNLQNRTGKTLVPPCNCGGCDNCLAPRGTWDGTLAAQKFLSCVYRIREKSGFGVGIQHVVEVLCGADTEKVRKLGHQTLTTYNIGGEHTRAEWGAIGRELTRLGLLFQKTDKFNIVELTEAGRAALKSRQKITLTKPVASTEPARHRIGEIACDEALFEKLRALRKQLADARGVPPYIVFSDVALRQMARFYPVNGQEFSRISGVGDKKLHELGRVFLAEIAEHLRRNPRQMFADDSFSEVIAPLPRGPRLTDTVRETLHFFQQGKSVAEIARLRGFKDSTILSHLEEAMLAGEAIDVKTVVGAEAQRAIAAAFQKHGLGSLGVVVESLGGRYNYGECRVVRAALRRA